MIVDSSVKASLVTVIAPAAWGSTYLVAGQLLPADSPLWAALLRALPAGLVLLALRRRRPTGVWWLRSLVLGAINFAIFFPLLFVAAFHLPGGVASTIQAVSPVVVMAFAWALIQERPSWARAGGGTVGVIGVALLVLRGATEVDLVGVLAAAGSVVASSLGFVLVKKWQAPVDMVTLMSWQLMAGGLVLVPVAALIEGGPPPLSSGSVGGLLWIGGIGTVVAYLCWFHGLSRLPAGTVALIGLANPVVATALGVVAVGEHFGVWTGLGMGLVLSGVLAGQPAFVAWLRRARRPVALEGGRAMGVAARSATPVGDLDTDRAA